MAHCGKGRSLRVRGRSALVQHFLAAAIHLIYTHFRADKDITDAFVYLRKITGGRGGGQRRASPGDISQTPEQPSKMITVILVVCAVFGLTVSESKIDTMCLRTKGMSESHHHIQWRGTSPHVYQTKELVCLGDNLNHSTDVSIEVDRRIRNAWYSFRKYTLECTTDLALPSSSKSGC